ncbi:hypothetical protein [Embleya sp. NPDC005575]|uniref:hypothetical protein n=1 Tax=Embleya sp. NPDC005575 TaxID=3156892 RepID=UPI0033A74F2A
MHAVHGLGGVGKSPLAAKRGKAVRWWITADTAACGRHRGGHADAALQPGLTELPAELQTERAV